MKIGTSEIYEQYTRAVFENRSALTNDINHYTKSKDYLLGKLVPFKHYLDNFTNIDYKEIKDLDRVIPEKSIKTFTNLVGLDVQSLKITLDAIVDINRILKKSNKELDEVNKSEMDKDLFKEIIYRFNTKLSDEIIYRGYIFRPGFGIGNTRIKKVRTDLRVKKRINWCESNKIKKEIIARGGIPFKVTLRDDLGKIVEDNGGEKWFVYFNTDFDYLWHWGKKTATAINVPYYKFRPTKYNNTSKEGKLGNVNKLKQLVTANSPLLSNFFIYEYI
jgi:hypothetical protein